MADDGGGETDGGASPAAAAASPIAIPTSAPIPYPTPFTPSTSLPPTSPVAIPTKSRGSSFLPGLPPAPTGPVGGINLKAIGFTCAGGFVVSAFTLLAFGLAVKNRKCGIAPRCTARDPDTIYNPRAGRGRVGNRSAKSVARSRARSDGRWIGWRVGRWMGGALFGCGRGGGEGGDKASKAKLARAEARAGSHSAGIGAKGTLRRNVRGKGGLVGGLLARARRNERNGGAAAGGGAANNGEEESGVVIHTSSDESVDNARHHHQTNGTSSAAAASSSIMAKKPTRHGARGTSTGTVQSLASVNTSTSSMPSRLKYGDGSDKYAPAAAATVQQQQQQQQQQRRQPKISGVAISDTFIPDLDDDNSLMENGGGHGGDDMEDNYHDNGDPDPNDIAVQWRGNPFTGWIPWTLALSYDTMLRGVPGTGTRRHGLDGAFLRVNLDAIVLFRFHAICLRVAVLATILCIGVVLPLNLTARCHNITNDPTDPDYDPQCFSADYQLTDYERTTLKNIPPLTYADADDPLKNISDDAGFVERLIAAFKHSAANTIWGSAYRRNLGRLYGIVLCSWIITWYALRIIGREWVDALALRRVYYLENDHWEDRKEELSETLLRDDEDGDSDDEDEVGGRDEIKSLRRRRKANKAGGGGGGGGGKGRRGKKGKGKKQRTAHRRRDPWIPHPEQRDTVPNVELYSVLVGGLPSLPSEVVDEQDIEAAVGYSRRQSIDWQLAVATSFFDHCVPNQPGFSSSIAAITILPDAPELARAWRKWYVAAAALRRLRFIRTLIADLRHYDFDDFDDGESEGSFENENTPKESIEMKLADPNRRAALNGAFHSQRLSHGGAGGAPMGAMNNLDTVGVDISFQAPWNDESTNGIASGADTSDAEAKAIYLDMQRRMKYYRDVFGSSDNEDVEALLFQALNYGPEQSAVYSREMAQGAAACCPNGCGEERLRRAGIDELLVLERDAIAAVHDANLNLQYAQARAAVSVLDTGDPKMHLPQKGHREEMEKHLEEDRNFVPLRSNFVPKDDRDSGTANALGGLTPKRTSDFSESSGGKSHQKSASLEDLSLPDALQMEGQLLAKYRRNPGLNPSRPAPISRHASAPISNVFSEETILTPTVTNHKRAQRGQAKDEGIEMGLQSLALPTISEGSRSKSAKPSGAGAYPMSSRVPSQQSHPSTVYVSSDPDHPLLRDDKSTTKKSTTGGNSTTRGEGNAPTPCSSISTAQTHNTKGGKKSLYGRIPHGPSGLATDTNKAMALSADGKFYLRDAISPRGSPPSASGGSFDNSSIHSTRRSLSPTPNLLRSSKDSNTGNLIDLPPSTASNTPGQGEWPPASATGVNLSGLSRRRLNTDASLRSSASQRPRTYSGTLEPSVQWAAVERIISDDTTIRERDSSLHNSERYAVGGKHKPTTGVWKMPTFASIVKNARDVFLGIFKAMWAYATHKTNAVVDDLARESTFAVVTFTSRQAAVAARHCIADGRGQSRWLTVEEVPVPPLADAAACDFITCRGCCRPVSLSIPKKQQMLRKYFSFLLLAVIYIFYTFPISAAAAFADPTKLYQLWPELEEIVENSVLFRQILSGIVPALLFTLFFALCPVMFKAIANFGSNATSVAVAEKSALNYYWWFMVCTAFSGSSLMTTVLNAFNEGQVANSVTEVLIEIAGTIPTQVSSTWINWIIVRTTMTLPLQYMLQVNTFVFEWLGWHCLARCVVGGGPGGPIPYRIYIDSGVVFLCIVSLAPASPLVAPFALLYFLYCAPLWRRNCLFVYRPKFDSGGSRWPFLSEVFMWSMVVGQILLTTMMALKEAVGPAIFAALPIIPTLLFRKMSRHRFLQSYMDAGLLQTSLLDGWDNGVPTTLEKREEFRQFLVDGHKAAYIPICIAGGATNVLTAEPALVMPHENDTMDMNLPPADIDADHQQYGVDDSSIGWGASTPEVQARASTQYGASLRRLPAGTMRPTVNDDDYNM